MDFFLVCPVDIHVKHWKIKRSRVINMARRDWKPGIQYQDADQFSKAVAPAVTEIVTVLTRFDITPIPYEI